MVGVAGFVVVASGYPFNFIGGQLEQLAYLPELVASLFETGNDLPEGFRSVPAAAIGMKNKDCSRPDAGHDPFDNMLRCLQRRRVSRGGGPLNHKKACIIDRV